MEDRNKKPQGQAAVSEAEKHAKVGEAEKHAGKSHTMTHKEAGHLGGVAPHTCRGSECKAKHGHAKTK